MTGPNSRNRWHFPNFTLRPGRYGVCSRRRAILQQGDVYQVAPNTAVKRAVLFLAIAALWSATTIETRGAFQTLLSGATITLTSSDPRNPNLIDRDWGVRLRNFRGSPSASEIYVGSGD